MNKSLYIDPDQLDPAARVDCASCDFVGAAADLAPAHGPLTPGDPSPAGRCPDCGAFAYVHPGDPASKSAQGVAQTAAQTLADDQPGARLPADVIACLGDAQGAIAGLDHNIGQMEGLFPDDDGTIADARADGDACDARLAAILAKYAAPPLPAGAPDAATLESVQKIVGSAESYLEDWETGLENGTYDDPDGLAERVAAVAHVRAWLAIMAREISPTGLPGDDTPPGQWAFLVIAPDLDGDGERVAARFPVHAAPDAAVAAEHCADSLDGARVLEVNNPDAVSAQTAAQQAAAQQTPAQLATAPLYFHVLLVAPDGRTLAADEVHETIPAGLDPATVAAFACDVFSSDEHNENPDGNRVHVYGPHATRVAAGVGPLRAFEVRDNPLHPGAWHILEAEPAPGVREGGRPHAAALDAAETDPGAKAWIVEAIHWTVPGVVMRAAGTAQAAADIARGLINGQLDECGLAPVPEGGDWETGAERLRGYLTGADGAEPGDGGGGHCDAGYAQDAGVWVNAVPFTPGDPAPVSAPAARFRFTADQPAFAVVLEGGMVSAVVAADPALAGVRFRVIDYDTDGADPADLIKVPQVNPDGAVTRHAQATAWTGALDVEAINAPYLGDLAPVAGDDETDADADGWTAHDGGPCPVTDGERVDVRHRDGMEHQVAVAGADLSPAEDWSQSGDPGDILAWRRAAQTPTADQPAPDLVPVGTPGRLVRRDDPTVEIVGTRDYVPATAVAAFGVRQADGSIAPEYDGGSKVHWDEQVNASQLEGGETLYTDENGADVPESGVILVPLESDPI